MFSGRMKQRTNRSEAFRIHHDACSSCVGKGQSCGTTGSLVFKRAPVWWPTDWLLYWLVLWCYLGRTLVPIRFWFLLVPTSKLMECETWSKVGFDGRRRHFLGFGSQKCHRWCEAIGKPEENGGLMVILWNIYPLVNVHITMENHIFY